MSTPSPQSAETRFSNTFLRLKKKLERGVGEAIADFNMIEDGDTVMVCVSGGKDSYSLLSILLALRERAPVDFRIVAMNLDQKQPGFPAEVLPAYFESIGVEYRIVTEDTYSIVKDKIPEGKTTCSLCSRLRRGIIYRVAREIGATKIALGHHRDDMLETLFLNMFFGGKIKAMPPKLVSDDGQHVVIRPLAYCTENDIARFARAMDFPIIPCNLCGSQENAQRKQIKAMLAGWARDYPGRIESLATALQNVVPSHLADQRLFDFQGLDRHTVVAEGDTAFDPPELPRSGGDVIRITPLD
ncbi:tRNA 2-thiocytidine(32) synthetase TtcA [Pseudothauera rhizosphaerae]|uniref:tRNA-cytidine(32) 2-sulfurtransferase n=1 Tax=Pseudothauera rhizosphaerae TaxID=2565932 RepID=A0A4S4AJ34_9RHOO|nr:tRNA 2-thiocytidine(32) synthetase TtcA [Pseudothauera rhizosphaerae]THF59395.1 tRNA 2-thiocytidine(32) synthetase TtcA [Pseudothauera rhizosphaerae]